MASSRRYRMNEEETREVERVHEDIRMERIEDFEGRNRRHLLCGGEL